MKTLSEKWAALEADCRRVERLPTWKEILELVGDRDLIEKDAEIDRLRKLIEQARRNFDECAAIAASMERTLQQYQNVS